MTVRFITKLGFIFFLSLLNGCGKSNTKNLDSKQDTNSSDGDIDSDTDTDIDTDSDTDNDSDTDADTQIDPNSDADSNSDANIDTENGSDNNADSSVVVDTDTSTAWEEETIDPTELPTEVPVVEIVIAEADKELLENAPFYGDDVPGTFVDGNGKNYIGVDINYRGAYALLSLIEGDPIGRRNWKVKFPKEEMYQGRREWNFNFEPHLRQKMAYDLMKFAGVKVPDATHVLLKINGEPQGLYLQYEDPDSKDWLHDKFGNDEGDLYKAATDLPESEGEPDKKYFAETTYLGDLDSDYFLHYNKKTNHKDPAIAEDHSVLRHFLDSLNHTSEEDFAEWLQSRFDIDGFIRYLVVSNFISNWDSFPQRPKNFWLFENRRNDKIVFIPWDLDATFQPTNLIYNQMGVDTPLLFSLQTFDYEPIHEEEGTERPLAWRMMAIPEFQADYINQYRILSETILSEAYLQERIDALNNLIAPHLTDALTSEGGRRGDVTEREAFEDALDIIRDYISDRTMSVSEQLASFP